MLLGMTHGELFLVVALFLLVYAAGFLKRGGDALERVISSFGSDDSNGPRSGKEPATHDRSTEADPPKGTDSP